MVQNNNIQSPIPLDGGPGLRLRDDQNYVRGEYSHLKNVEIIDGSLRLRRPVIRVGPGGVVAVAPANYGIPYFTNFGGVTINGSCLWMSALEQNWVWDTVNDYLLTAFASTSLAAPPEGHGTVGDGNNHRVLASVEYGGKFFWLTHRQSNTVDDWRLYEATASVTTGNLLALPTVYTVILTNVQAFDTSDASNFVKMMVHKDRLFILLKDRLYFSKATDFRVFSVPDGGFIDTDSGTFYDMIAIGDTIYIATTKGLYSYNYSSDPNKDGFLKPIQFIDEAVYSLVIHDNVVYAGTALGIYAIYNNNAEIVVDHSKVASNLPINYGIIKMVAFGDSIVYGVGTPYAGNHSRFSSAIQRGTLYTYFFNVESNSVSEFSFRDNFDLPAGQVANAGGITDFIYVPYSRVLVFAWTYYNVDVTPNVNLTRFYSMDLERDARGKPYHPYVGVDRVRYSFGIFGSTAELTKFIPIEYRVAIRNWTPDGSEHLLKKFRLLRLQGKLPSGPTAAGAADVTYGKVEIGYDDNAAPYSHLNNDLDTIKPLPTKPFTYALKLNQKARALTVQFIRSISSGDQALYDSSDRYFFSLEDIRSIWGYTQHHGRKE